jgi:hypothetical protein
MRAWHTVAARLLQPSRPCQCFTYINHISGSLQNTTKSLARHMYEYIQSAVSCKEAVGRIRTEQIYGKQLSC